MITNIMHIGRQLTWEDAQVSQATRESDLQFACYSREIVKKFDKCRLLLIKYRQGIGDNTVPQWEVIKFKGKRQPRSHNMGRVTTSRTINYRQAREILRQLTGQGKEIYHYRCEHGEVYDINPWKGARIPHEAKKIN